MNLLKKILFLFVIALSLWLRFYHYTNYPQRGATSDEYTYSFLGTSLLTKGVPISWSAFQAYKNREDLTIDGIYFPIVRPYFDHPPLYAITVGSFLLLFHQTSFALQQLWTIRLVPIVLSTVTSILLFFFAKRLYGFRVAIVSLLLYSTVTIFVMNQRVSVAENQVALFFVLGLYLYQRWQKKLTKKRIVILGIVAGLACITKIMGIALFISFFFLLIQQRIVWRKIGVFTLVFVLSSSLLLLYAWHYDWQLFWSIQSMQSGRNIGPESLLLLLLQPVIVNKVYFDGWYFLGLVALSFLTVDFKKHGMIITPATIYFLCLIASLTKEGQSGWYMIPEFAFMAIAISVFVVQTLGTKSITFLLVPLLVGLSQIQYLFEPIFGLSSVMYRLLLAVLFLPLLLLFLFKKDFLYRKVGYIYFFFFLVCTVILTHRYIHPS